MEKEMSLQEGMEFLQQELGKEEKKNVVNVYDNEGNALKPCSNKRARILLERGQAVILSYVPFTIRLEKDTGSFFDEELVLHKGTVQVCVSSLGQNRTEFMLRNAIELSKKHQKVLFISSIVYEYVLNALIQQIAGKDVAFMEYFHGFSASNINDKQLEEWIDQFEPDVVIVDERNITNKERKIAKAKEIAFWVGATTKCTLERMPLMHDVRSFGALEQDASLIIGLYGNQTHILKNRFGETGKGTHQKNLTFYVE